MAHQPMLLPDPSERPFLPEGSCAPARGPEWLEEDSGNYLAELAAKLASHGGGESSADLALDIMLNKIVDQARLATAKSGAAIALCTDGEMVCRASVGENLRRADDVGSSVDVASSVEEKSEEQRPYQEPVSPLAALSPVSEPSRREPDPVPPPTHEDQKDEQPSFVPPKLLFETESAARRDYWTTVLSWVVIVLALVLGWMVGRAGWKTAVSLFKAQTDAVSVAPETEQTNTSSKKKAPNFGIMSAPPRWVGKKKEWASSNASTSDTSQAKEEAEPPFVGGLRVYQNGRVIFRIGPSVEKPTQMPVELAAQTTTYEATPIESAAGAGPRTIPATVINSYLIKKVEPEYPEQAKQDHIQGLVELKALVGTDGTVKGVKVISGDPRLVDAVSKAVRGWLFKPYAPEGKPIDFETEITVNFSLSEETQQPNNSTPQ